MFSSIRWLTLAAILFIIGVVLSACTAYGQNASATRTKTAIPETETRASLSPKATHTKTAIPEADIPDTAQPENTPTNPASSLPDLGAAPDFTNEVWINTDAPLTLDKLRGKVVLVEFWTFG